MILLPGTMGIRRPTMFTCQRLLLPLDGSPLAERAISPAFAVAKALSSADTPCAVHLFRVVPPLLMAIDPVLYAETLHYSEEEACHYLEAIEANWATDDTPASIAVETGPVAESIITYAQHKQINLIVMSSHGRSGVGRWVYGSVAEKVLRQACCASLIIRQPEDAPSPETFRHILVCLDGSPLAEQVLTPILTLARAMQAQLTFLRVVPPSHLALETLALEQLLNQVENIERDSAEVYLRQLLGHLPLGELNVKAETILGPPPESIIDYAQENQVDLIAMSSHGRSGVSRWVYGSVAEKVLRGAGCATFIIRGQEEK
jgi:nucleotide-binding universal stress UspA family protein